MVPLMPDPGWRFEKLPEGYRMRLAEIQRLRLPFRPEMRAFLFRPSVFTLRGAT